MFRRMELWWQQLQEEFERECFEKEHQAYEDEQCEIERIRQEKAENCPECGTPLRVGVGDTTIGRTCTNCHYHDFYFRYPEIEEL